MYNVCRNQVDIQDKRLHNAIAILKIYLIIVEREK